MEQNEIHERGVGLKEQLLTGAAVRFADKEMLQKLNDEAIRRDYNRAIVPEFVAELGEDTVFAIAPILVHEHAQGRSVAPHLRCSVRSVGGPDLGFLMLDVPFELFELLLEHKEPNSDV